MLGDCIPGSSSSTQQIGVKMDCTVLFSSVGDCDGIVFYSFDFSKNFEIFLSGPH